MTSSELFRPRNCSVPTSVPRVVTINSGVPRIGVPGLVYPIPRASPAFKSVPVSVSGNISTNVSGNILSKASNPSSNNSNSKTSGAPSASSNNTLPSGAASSNTLPSSAAENGGGASSLGAGAPPRVFTAPPTKLFAMKLKFDGTDFAVNKKQLVLDVEHPTHHGETGWR